MSRRGSRWLGLLSFVAGTVSAATIASPITTAGSSIEPEREAGLAPQPVRSLVSVAHDGPRLPSAVRVPQTLAFSRYRFGALYGDVVRVFRTGDLQQVAQFEAPQARHLVSLVGGSFLTLSPKEALRLSPRSSRPRRFRAPAAAFAVARLFPHPAHSRRLLALLEDGRSLHSLTLDRVAASELALEARPVRSATDFTGDGMTRMIDATLAYTTAQGLSLQRGDRVTTVAFAPPAKGEASLVSGTTPGQLWVIEAGRARLVASRNGATLRSVELPERVVAADAQAGRLAVLSVERPLREVRLRVDVYDADASPRTVRFSDGTTHRPMPEVRLSERGSQVAVRYGRVQLFDYRRGARVLTLGG